MYICKGLQIFFKALELIAWFLHSNLARNVIFWVASTRTLLTRDCSISLVIERFAAICCNLLADVAILSQNARFARIAKDHIRLRKSYSLQQIAAICNNAPKKNFPDVNRC